MKYIILLIVVVCIVHIWVDPYRGDDGMSDLS